MSEDDLEESKPQDFLQNGDILPVEFGNSSSFSNKGKDAASVTLKPPHTGKPFDGRGSVENGNRQQGERRRRRLPTIPSDRKPLSRLCLQPRLSSLADELRDAEVRLQGAEGTKLKKTKVLHHQVSENLYLEIETSGSPPKSCLRFYRDPSQGEEDSSPEDFRSRLSGDLDSGNSTAHSPDGLKSISPVVNGSLPQSSPSPPSSTPSCSRLHLQDATHRGLHKFIPRHKDEIEIEIGDPVYVRKEAEDLWCEGINLRTGAYGIFPGAYATDVEYSDFDPEGIEMKRERYLVDFLGSVEVSFYKGNGVLCSAVRKVARAQSADVEVKAPHPCILEISDHGIRMVDRNRPMPKHVPTHDYFFNLKNVTFCGYHPRDYRYFGFITKHPLHHRFACHVFMGKESTQDVAKAVGRAFHRFYHKFIEMAYPVEDIYLE